MFRVFLSIGLLSFIHRKIEDLHPELALPIDADRPEISLVLASNTGQSREVLKNYTQGCFGCQGMNPIDGLDRPKRTGKNLPGQQ